MVTITPLPTGSTVRALSRNALPASPRKNGNKPAPPSPVAVSGVTFPSGAKSPIKKHLQHAATAKWPQQHAMPAASLPPASPHTGDRPASTLGAMRASIIQVMLGLLDQDSATVEGTIPILETLAALPLANATTRRECLQLLTTLEQRCASSPSKTPPSVRHHQPFDRRFDAASDVATSEGDSDRQSNCASASTKSSETSARSSKTTTRSSASARDSGRAKSASLIHCKAFLLACANEIHELDSVNPNFDYAEDTSSEVAADSSASAADTRSSRVTARSRLSCNISTSSSRVIAFDYVSTVASSSSASVMTDIDRDDVEADQGSEFSEVLHRADYMSDMDASDDDDASDTTNDSDDALSLTSWTEDTATQQQQNAKTAICALDHARVRVLCRHALYTLRAAASASRATRNAFVTLKQFGRQAATQRRAFEGLKRNVQQMRLKRRTMATLRNATWPCGRSSSAATTRCKPTDAAVVSPAAAALRAKMLVAQHLDVVFVALCAAFVCTVGGS